MYRGYHKIAVIVEQAGTRPTEEEFAAALHRLAAQFRLGHVEVGDPCVRLGTVFLRSGQS